MFIQYYVVTWPACQAILLRFDPANGSGVYLLGIWTLGLPRSAIFTCRTLHVHSYPSQPWLEKPAVILVIEAYRFLFSVISRLFLRYCSFRLSYLLVSIVISSDRATLIHLFTIQASQPPNTLPIGASSLSAIGTTAAVKDYLHFEENET